MRMLLVVALCVIGFRAIADSSLLDNCKWFRSGCAAETVVWGKNPDGSKNVTLIQNGKSEVQIGTSLDLSKYAGKDIEFVIVADGENVVRGTEKGKRRPFCPLMTHYETKFGEWGVYRRNEIAGDCPEGSFKGQEFVLPFMLPKLGYNFGLNLFSNCESGKIVIKKLFIREAAPYLDKYLKLPKDFRCQYSKGVLKYYDGKHTLRGIVAGERFNEEDYKKMRGWGANLIRFWCNPLDLAKTDALLPVLNRLGFKVILAPQCPGGRGNRMGYELFRNEKLYLEYLENMKIMAEHFKGDKRVFAIGLMNEPFQPLREAIADPHFFLDVQREAAKLIRVIDPDRVLVASATGGGSSADYALSDMRPLPMKDIIYEMHFYYPMFCTHLGLFGNRLGPDVKYPGGKKRGTTWTKETLRECMSWMDDFEKTYGAKIFVGEFSCKNNCPGAAQWLDDVCDLLDERKYIWTYHDYGEYHGWNLEYRSDVADDRRPEKLMPGETGDRLEVMKRQWSKNLGERGCVSRAR